MSGRRRPLPPTDPAARRPAPPEGYLDVTTSSPTLTWAAGAMISTAEDIRRIQTGLLSGRLLPPAILEQLLSTVSVDTGWGYGWGSESQDRACGGVWGHGASVQGSSRWRSATEAANAQPW